MQEQEPWRRLLLRTEETATRYEKALKEKLENGVCRLCADLESIVEYQYWRLMPNKFPYDRYFSKSDMLVLKRHSDERGLSPKEKEEYFQLIGSELADRYDSILNHLPKQKSIPHHCHFHLVKIKQPKEV